MGRGVDGRRGGAVTDGTPRAWLLAFLLCLPAAAQEAPPAPDGPSGPIAVGGEAVADDAIAERLRGILAQLGDYEGVGVAVEDGVVAFSGEALTTDAIGRLDALAGRVEGVVAVRNEVAANTDVGDRIDPLVERTGSRVAQALAYLPLLAIALAVGLVVSALGWLLASWRAPWRRLAPNAFVAGIYRTVVRLSFTALGVVVALDILGATAVLTTVLGAAGVIGLAVGFAVRDTVENFIASVMLSLRQPFGPGDFVEIEGDQGTVVRLTSRATILLDTDGNHLRLPNATVFKGRILNFTRNDERRFGFKLGIDPAGDAALARRIGLEALRGLPFTLDAPPPHAWIEDAGDWTIDMMFYAWIEQSRTDFMIARSEAIRTVMAALTRAGIGLPEPTYRLAWAGGDVPEAVPSEARQAEPSAPRFPADTGPAAPVSPDRSVARMAEEERAREEDLLREGSAPE